MVSVVGGLLCSAQQHVAATLRNAMGVGVMAPSHLSLRREVNMYYDGSCLAPSRVGGWAYVLVDSARALGSVWPIVSPDQPTHGLTAVIRGLGPREPCRCTECGQSACNVGLPNGYPPGKSMIGGPTGKLATESQSLALAAADTLVLS